MPTELTGAEALQRLMDGNQRWKKEMPHRPRQTVAHRLHVATNGQTPFAIFIGCSDSRVPGEIFFDCGLGDLFVIRIAGHALSEFELGTIEYGAHFLRIPLIMVVGHQDCGAVIAAANGHEVPGHIGLLVQAVKPAITIAREMTGDIIENAVRANVTLVINQIMTSSPLLRELAARGQLATVGGYYHLQTGEVSIISPEDQEKMLAIS